METWKLGTALETYMNLLQQIGTEGVEAKLKQIREETFERMRNVTKRVYPSSN
jgi:hypothetical protein